GAELGVAVDLERGHRRRRADAGLAGHKQVSYRSAHVVAGVADHQGGVRNDDLLGEGAVQVYAAILVDVGHVRAAARETKPVTGGGTNIHVAVDVEQVTWVRRPDADLAVALDDEQLLARGRAAGHLEDRVGGSRVRARDLQARD